MRTNVKQRLIAAGTIALVATLALSACSGGKTAVTSSGDSDTESIGLLYATRGDFAIMDSAYAGFTAAQKQFGFTPVDFSSPNVDDFQDRLDLAISQELGLAIGVGYQWAGPMSETDGGKTLYANVDVDQGTVIDGVTTISFAANESSYLAGIAAALTSESNHVGFIGGVDLPLIQNFFVGFEAGAKSVNPDIVVDSTYLSPLGDFSGFSDPTKGKEAAASMYAAGADVVYAAAGGSGQGVYEQAKLSSESSGSQVWAIGVDGDVYSQVDDALKPYILTSAVKNVGVAVEDVIAAFFDGTLKPGEQVYNLATDGVGYSTSGGFVDAIVDQIEEAKAAIIAGTIKVPSAL